MALKPTIYKLTLALSNLDTHYFDNITLTVAQHPSETTGRMMARILAFCLNASELLTFTAGLSTPDEPDIWARSLDDQLLLWVDVGEPAFERLKKASRLSQAVHVYSFNSKSDVWWQQEQSKIQALKVSVFQFPWESIQALAGFVERSMDWSITITDGTLYIAAPKGELEIPCVLLKE